MRGNSNAPLVGKVALVTGGSRGIGAAVARRLAAAGADVAISYRRSTSQAEALVEEIEAQGVRAGAFRADQGDSAEVVAMVGAVAESFGRIDILVNNAGVVANTTISEVDADVSAVADQWATNVAGVAATTRAATKHMPDGGRVILVSSIAAARTSVPGFGDYAASKAAVEAYGRAWARDLAPRGITVNTIRAGFTATDMPPPADSEFGRFVTPSIALGRYARAEEIANVVAFLAGPESSYMTGSTVAVDGGWDS